MTTSYMSKVTSAVCSISFTLMRKWHGNLIKLIWIDLLVFAIVYTCLTLIYRLALNDSQKDTFEKFCLYCNEKVGHIPLGFLLGFLTSQVLSRWWSITQSVPRFMKAAIIIRINISKGDKSKCLGYRRAILRQINLAWILKMRLLSPQIWKRFVPTKNPKMHHTNIISTLKYINSDIKVKQTLGRLMTNRELESFIRIALKRAQEAQEEETFGSAKCGPKRKCDTNSTDPFHHQPVEYWLPMMWAYRTIQQAERGDHLTNGYSRSSIESVLNDIQNKFNHLDLQDRFPIPLPYIQAIILGIHVYFLAKVFAEQFLDPSRKVAGHDIDLYFPVFTLLEFMFYFSWFKAAMSMLNPHGDDDEDLPLWTICEENLKLSRDIALAGENESEDIEFTENFESQENHSNFETKSTQANKKNEKSMSGKVHEMTQFPSNHVLTDPDAVFFSSEHEQNDLDNKFELNSEEDRIFQARYQSLSKRYQHKVGIYEGPAIDAARRKEQPHNPFHRHNHQCKHTENDLQKFEEIKILIENKEKERQNNFLPEENFEQANRDFYSLNETSPLV